VKSKLLHLVLFTLVANLQKLESLTVLAQEEIQNLTTFNTLLTGIPNFEGNVDEEECSLNPGTNLSENPSIYSFSEVGINYQFLMFSAF